MQSLIDYINKELSILERKEDMPYTEDDLKDLFNKFNKEYFDNQLDSIPISYNGRNAQMGIFYSTYNRAKKENTPVDIQITANYYLNKNQIESILLHEMIHYWVMLNYPKEHNSRETHGRMFQAKMNLINKQLKDYQIYTIFPEVVSRIKKDKFNLFIFKYKGKWSFIKFKPKYTEELGNKLVFFLLKYKGESVSDIFLVQNTTDDYFQVFKTQRTFNSFYNFKGTDGFEAFDRVMLTAQEINADDPRFNKYAYLFK